GDEARRAVEADRLVAEGAKAPEMATRATAEIENRERARPFEARPQRVHVLADVVVLRPLAEIVGVAVVVADRYPRNVAQIVGAEHARGQRGGGPREGVSRRQSANRTGRLRVQRSLHSGGRA